MALCTTGQNIPKEWHHRPEIKNDLGLTVAMLYAA